MEAELCYFEGFPFESNNNFYNLFFAFYKCATYSGKLFSLYFYAMQIIAKTVIVKNTVYV